jgi:hypothetical protein
MAARSKRPGRPAQHLRANSVRDGAHSAAITEPHPRLSVCQHDVFYARTPYAGRFKLVERKPPPGVKLA